MNMAAKFVHCLLMCLAIGSINAKKAPKQDLSKIYNQKVPEVLSWNDFKTMYNKVNLKPEDEKKRMDLYEKNSIEIAICNEMYKGNLTTFYCGVNKYTDTDVGSFAMFAMLERVIGDKIEQVRSRANGDTIYRNPMLGKNRDWTTNITFNGLQDQGETCHAGYAFATAAVLEAQFYKLTHKKVKFSEQQIIDCTRFEANRKCDGGYIIAAFNYFIRKGIMLEEDYPYEGKPGKCRYDPSRTVAKVRKYQQVNNDELVLHKYLRHYGPVAATIHANLTSFQFYKSGIFNDPNCIQEKNTHAVVIVGIGDDHGVPYWKIRNSYGPTWGENGYARIYRGNNQCGIAMHTSIPELRLVKHKHYPDRIPGLTTIKPIIPTKQKHPITDEFE